MAKPETDLAPKIREKTLEMLMVKEPEEISTRDIARTCGVTATSIYYYYKDKEALYTEIKLACIENMNKFISDKIKKVEAKQRKQGRPYNPLILVKAGLEAFRDWAFNNPRIALLVMSRLKADKQADSVKLKKYYWTYEFAKKILDEAVQKDFLSSKDTLLDASLCIAALWGAIETVLYNRTIPKYWSKRGGIKFTNKMIDFVLASLALGNKQLKNNF